MPRPRSATCRVWKFSSRIGCFLFCIRSSAQQLRDFLIIAAARPFFFRALSFLQALFDFLALWVVAPSCVARFAQLHDFLVGPFLGALSCRAGFCALQRPLGAGSSALPLSSSAALLDVLHVPRCFWIHSLFLNAVIRASRLFLPCFSCVSGVRDAQTVCVCVCVCVCV